MQRRSILKLGIGAAAVLALAGGGMALLRPGLVAGRLTPEASAVFHAVARAVLDGSLPAAAEARETALQSHMKRLGDTLAAFPAPTQNELSQLLSLLASAGGRLALAGLPTAWNEASVTAIQEALQSMRTSSLALREQTYHALRDLTNAAYYADPDTWSLLGYPGPVAV